MMISRTLESLKGSLARSGNWTKAGIFWQIIRWKIKQTTSSGHKFANWHLKNLGKFDLLQRWRRARAAKSAPIFSTSESRELWRSSYFVKTGLDYHNYHTWINPIRPGDFWYLKDPGGGQICPHPIYMGVVGGRFQN